MSVGEDRRLRAVELTGLDAAPDPALDALARAACSALAAPVCLVSLLDDLRQFFPGAAGLPQEWLERRAIPLSQSLCRVVVEGGAPVAIPDARTDPRTADSPAVAEFGVVGYLGVPLLDDDGLALGSMCILDGVPRHWTVAEHAVLVALAEAACAQLHLRAERIRADVAADRAARMGALAAALAGALAVDDIAAVLAEQVQGAVGADAFSLRLIQPEQGVVRAMRFGGSPVGYRKEFVDIRLDRPSAVTEVVTTRQPVFIASTSENRERYGAEAGDNHEAARIGGLARLPLLVEGELVGLLSVGYRGDKDFPAEERLFLTTVADLAAQALGRAMRTERLRRLQSLSDLALSRLSLTDLAGDLGERLARMLHAAHVVLFVHEAHRLRPLGVHGRSIPLGRGIVGRGVALGGVVIVEDTAAVGLDDFDEALRGVRSVAVAPLLLDGQLVGAMAIGRDSPGPFAYADHELIGLAATRVALAVDRGRAFEHQRELARTLQAALLPPVLPDIAGMRTASTYQAAGAGIDVGGDFYDLFGLGNGEWLAVMGDVRGRGPAAAALTGLIRHTVRAVANEEHDPAAILARTNQLVFDATAPEDFATVACVRIYPTDGGTEVVIASAGHCAPLILRADPHLEVEVVETDGLVLGAFEDIKLDRVERSLGPGDVLLLHTDGLTEAPGSVDRFGEQRLVEHLGPLAGRSPEEIVDSVHRIVLAHCAGECDDDLAVLAIGVVPAGQGDPVELLEHALTPGPQAAADARRLVATLDVPGDLLEDLRLVVSELVTNAVRHGQPGHDILLRATRQGTRLRVEVRNSGDSFTVPEAVDPLAESGRGLTLVQEATVRFGIGRERGRVLVWCEFDLDAPSDS